MPLDETNRPAPKDRRLVQAAAHLERQEYREMHSLCMEVLRGQPDSAEALFLLGILAADHDNHRKACELFERVLVFAPLRARALARKARSLIALNQRGEALEAVELAVNLKPGDALTLDTIGVVFSRAGLHERAVPFYELAIAENANVPNYHYNHGAALQFLGHMDEARQAYRNCIDLKNDDARAYAAIIQITRQTPEKNEIAELEAMFPADPDTVAPETTLRLGHALAKAYEDLGEAKPTLEWLGKAKSATCAALTYTPDDDRPVFDAASTSAALPLSGGYTDAEPVFIVGMPRTGTTLTDRILSSHSLITSAGELADFSLCVKRLTGTLSNRVLDPEALAAAEHLDPELLGRTYIESVRKTLGETGRFVDKMPLNFFYSAIILQAFPNARVICQRRHAADTVLSNYRQLFANKFAYYNYAYDLETTAHYYVMFDQLIRDFSERLPQDKFCEVQYEHVVADIEGETRRLLSFCNLEFEPACLEFHKNAAPVATASSAQVRQPLYTTSLARWKRYETDLEDVLRILVEAGCMDAEELA